MADDWDAFDRPAPAKASSKVDSWDDDAPDDWDAPSSKNGPKSSNTTSTNAKGGAAKKQETPSSNSKPKSLNDADQKGIERARIELAKARDVADFISAGGQGEFELLQPTRKDEFDLLQDLIMSKISSCKESKEFNPFIESLCRKIANTLDTKTLKAINSQLAIIAKDKELADKAAQKDSANARPAAAEPAAPKPAAGVGSKKAPPAAQKGRANIKVGSVYDTFGEDEVYGDDDDFEDDFGFRAAKPVAPKPAATGGGYYDDEGEI